MMPSLADHHSDSISKVLMIGDSGAGKTGSLTSLVGAGYILRILDLDNGVDALKAFARHEFPGKLANVQYETRRDQYVSSPSGPIIKGMPKAFVDSLKLMTTWTDGTAPSEWGDKHIFVLDSLTALGRCAFEWAKGMNPTSKDPRQWFYAAQRAVEDVIAMLSSEAFRTNVIVISHITYLELADGTSRGYPSAIGTALSKHVAKYFNTLILCESRGSGDNVKRMIHTVPTSLIDLKNPAPFQMDKAYPIKDGMAKVFETLRNVK